jgi:asparagine synthase (glutamine-hydrolysing)
MSVIFGNCLSTGSAMDDTLVRQLGYVTARYGPDGTDTLISGRIGMGFQAFHTHARSRLGRQLIADDYGNLIALDGRIDNHKEFSTSATMDGSDCSDSSLVLKAFERWGEECFSHLVGDWAIALWSTKDQTLYLARDHAGARTLYYRCLPGQVRWSTYLETFFVDDSSPDLDHEYVSRVLGGQETGDLTPYKGIRAVPPAHYVAFREGHVTLHSHWRWIADSEIAYLQDAEYDEHFRYLFRQAVERRIVPGAPILAELSGGMDSSSIVCVADKIASEGHNSVGKLDTVSYYDDAEPDWDERPYFTAVETHRNKEGFHLDCSMRAPTYEPLVFADRIYPYPVGDRAAINIADQFERTTVEGQYRVILSGIGGDELLGGVPTPMPELADYLRYGKLSSLLSGASVWCLASRQPLVQMLQRTMTFTVDLYRSTHSDLAKIPPWLGGEAREICSYPRSLPKSKRELFASRPSAIVAGRTWWHLLDSLPHLCPRVLGCYEYRTPYLDRDLVDFLHRIPRRQLVQPRRRRLLMRRALREIVPQEVLERKRKAYVSRGPITQLRNNHSKIEKLFSTSLLADLGLIDPDKFIKWLRIEIAGGPTWIGHLRRAVEMELWLHSRTKRPGMSTERLPVSTD